MMIQSLMVGLALWSSMLDEPAIDSQSESAVSRLVRWSASEPIIGEVSDVNTQGVIIKRVDEVIPVHVPWYDVHSLDGDRKLTDKKQQLAQDAWRAHARLVRGDYAGAETIYAQLEDAYLWKIGKQSADVSLGLVRCRLNRQDRVRAVMPFLSLLMSQPSEALFGQQAMDGFDSQYRLLIGLPPVFGAFEHTRSMPSMPELDSISTRQRVLGGYYALAMNASIHRTSEAQDELDQLAVLMRGRDNRDSGLEFVADMVIAQAHTDADKRLAARLGLERKIRSNPDTWIELWARLALGVSLIADDETLSNERGAIELIHVVVRLDQINPPLAILASQIANEYFVRTQRAPWGSALILESQNGRSNN